MKLVLPALTAVLVAIAVLLFWGLGRDDRRRFDAPEPMVENETDSKPDVKGSAIPRPPYDRTKDLPGWIEGRGILASKSKRGAHGLPVVVDELEALCHGRNAKTANTMATKRKLLELSRHLDTMSLEEKQRLAEYFRNSDNPALKYHMMIIFRQRCGEPFVDAVTDYYDVEPQLVAESLQYMIGRTPKAADAFGRLLAEEIDPARREMLLSRAAFVGSEHAAPLILAAFDAGAGTVDRRIAASGLTRIKTDDARARIKEILEGEFEEAVYDVASDGPRDESMRDIRCHTVIGSLINGEAKDIRSLWERYRRGDEGDQVAGYIGEFFGSVQSPEFVPDIVGHMIEKGQLNYRFLIYISHRASPEYADDVRRLLDMNLGQEDRGKIERLIEKVR